MKFNTDTEAFINNYIKALKEKNAVVFAGAGMSVSQGFFDWKKLLKPIADRLELDIEDEMHDLAALAQYFVDDKGGVRGELNQILLEEYGRTDLTISENHRILARLPITIYWTTNYDRLIEEALIEFGKTPDVKKAQADLTVNLPKRDAIIYKMHGDIGTVAETVLTKHEYEDYNKSRELFSIAFKTDFVSRTFLFIGFSFTDPNLEYLISRIRTTLGHNIKPDYFFIKREIDLKEKRRQELRTNSLKRYGFNPVWIDDYTEITQILKEIETRLLRSTILVSGSIEEYRVFDENRTNDFLYNLSKAMSKNNYKILTGFGLRVGSVVINGVLENMKTERNKSLDNYLIMRPFPQIESTGASINEMWTLYRRKFIPLAGISIFVFGNKMNKDSGTIELSDGMIEEFEIAIDNNLMVIPVGATGDVARILWEKVISDFEKYYPHNSDLISEFMKLGDTELSNGELIQIILYIINVFNH